MTCRHLKPLLLLPLGSTVSTFRQIYGKVMYKCWWISCIYYSNRTFSILKYFDDNCQLGKNAISYALRQSSGQRSWSAVIRRVILPLGTPRSLIHPVLFRKDIVSLLQKQVLLPSDEVIFLLPKHCVAFYHISLRTIP